MAGSIKGIIVEIGGDTSGLQNALTKVNKQSASLTKELNQVNSTHFYKNLASSTALLAFFYLHVKLFLPFNYLYISKLQNLQL